MNDKPSTLGSPPFFRQTKCGFWDASTCTKDQHGSWHLEFDPARNCRHRGESLERSWPHERHIGRHSGHPGYLGSGPMSLTGLTFSSIARVKKSYSCGETFIFLDVAGYFGAVPSVRRVEYWWISTSLETFEMILEHVDVGRYCWISPSILPILGDFSGSLLPSVDIAGSPHRPHSGHTLAQLPMRKPISNTSAAHSSLRSSPPRPPWAEVSRSSWGYPGRYKWMVYFHGKIHQWMRTRGYPHDYGNFRMSVVLKNFL